MHLVTDISVFVRPGSENIPRETWISEALNDSALFQATLLPSAAHYALFYNLDLAESFHLFDQTTRIVYKRLDDPEQGTSDATLAAVICLSFVEVTTPSGSPRLLFRMPIDADIFFFFVERSRQQFGFNCPHGRFKTNGGPPRRPSSSWVQRCIAKDGLMVREPLIE